MMPRTGAIIPVAGGTVDPTEHIERLVQLVLDEEISDDDALTTLHAAELNADPQALAEAVEALDQRDKYLRGWQDADCPPGCSQHAANELAADGWDQDLTAAVRRLALPARGAVA